MSPVSIGRFGTIAVVCALGALRAFGAPGGDVDLDGCPQIAPEPPPADSADPAVDLDQADVPGALPLRRGDRIVVIGNTFAERMALFGHFETALSARYPDHRFTFRNLGWSGDTVLIRQRPYGFGEMHRHLGDQKADVILACFGMADSFGGSRGLPGFRGDLTRFVGELLGHHYNGRSAPRLALISPIARESIAPGFEDETIAHNRDLAAYTAVMREVAADFKIPFADLFSPSATFVERQAAFPADLGPAPLVGDEILAATGRLTFNGIHLTDTGYWVVSRWLLAALGHESAPWDVTLDRGGGRPESSGTVISDVEFTENGVRFLAADLELPPPPAPVAAAKLPPGAAEPRALPRLRVLGLRPGQYELIVDGTRVGVADAVELQGRGMFLPPGSGAGSGAGMELTGRLRRLIVEKNNQFFHLWRPVNTEYIFGRRTKPFGVVNFPGELEALARLIGDLEGEIHARCQSPGPRSFELSRAEP